MLQKCANPDCTNEYKYFSEGLLFEFHVDESRRYRPLMLPPSPNGRREMFWLCQPCSVTMTLECRDGEVVVATGEKSVGGARKVA